METPELRTETIKSRSTTNPPAIAPTEQSLKDISENNKRLQNEIKENEFRSEIQDFLKNSGFKQQLTSEENISKAEQILFDQYFPFFQFGEAFTLMDLPVEEIANALDNGIREVRSESLESQNDKQVGHAEQLRSLVEQLKSEGLSNTAILARILAESESGDLMVPSEKLSEFRNYLKLLNSPSIPQYDRAELTGILNRPDFDITAADSFQQFGNEVLNSQTISESTKQILIKEFKIRPVVTGHDLKTELLSRHKLIAKRKGEIQELNDNLSSLKEDVKAYRSDLSTARFKLDSSNLSPSEREKLEKEVEEIESAISLIEEQQKEIKDSRKILEASTPKNEIQLGEAKASYADEQIEVQLPDSRNYLRLPIEMSPEHITKSVNSYLIYEEFEKRELCNIVFPEERLKDGADVPSVSMMNFVNEILSAINMSRNDEVLTMKDLEEFNRYMDCFSTEEAKGSVELEQRDFKELLYNQNGTPSNDRFIDNLQFLQGQVGKEGFSHRALVKRLSSS